jgi:hypothetical protein
MADNPLLLETTPKPITPEDGEQPAQPPQWNEDTEDAAMRAARELFPDYPTGEQS